MQRQSGCDSRHHSTAFLRNRRAMPALRSAAALHYKRSLGQARSSRAATRNSNRKAGLGKAQQPFGIIMPVIAAISIGGFIRPQIRTSRPSPGGIASSTIPKRCQRSFRSIACPFDDRATPTQTGITKVECFSRSYPRSRKAHENDQGHIKIGVQVSVDTSGNISRSETRSLRAPANTLRTRP